jgi:hypothetical protein
VNFETTLAFMKAKSLSFLHTAIPKITKVKISRSEGSIEAKRSMGFAAPHPPASFEWRKVRGPEFSV